MGLLKLFCASGLFLVLTVSTGFGQVNEKGWRLTKRHLDGLFSIGIPAKFGEPDRPADVSGGFFSDDSISINYNYWIYKNTPKFLRDSKGRYSKKPDLACSRNGQRTRTTRRTISGRQAVVQQCIVNRPNSKFRHLYYVTIPRGKVRDMDLWADGVFNLSIAYDDPKMQPVAKRIAESLRFDRR